MKREFLMLAKVLNLKKHSIGGMMASEKLDGFRVLWDGGVTRGMTKGQVPWSNTAKDGRFLETQIATGLWTRYGNVVHAPDWFLDLLPQGTILDGELFAGRGNFQPLRSAQHITPVDADWQKLTYQVFDAPTLSEVFADGDIKDGERYVKSFRGMVDWMMGHGAKSLKPCTFQQTYCKLLGRLFWNDRVILHPQIVLPGHNPLNLLNAMLDQIVELGGEGVMLRERLSFWTPGRSHELLKYKPFNDCEVRVVGYTWGRETDKGSKLLGKMGACFVTWNGKVFKVSGFTDLEREMTTTNVLLSDELKVPRFRDEYFTQRAGKDVDKTQWTNPRLPINSIFTIKYRELTDDGIPKEARYWRKPII